MTFKTGMITVAVVAAIAGACTTAQKGGGRGIASVFDTKGARPLKQAEISQYSATGAMGVQNAKIITDNYTSYKSKLDIINSAKQSLRLVYFIYDEDSSSAQLTDAIVKAAQRGVKVQILVDFLTNYGRIDLFKYMEHAGNGNVTVRFYGLPTQAIRDAALYSTTACAPELQGTQNPTACEDDKKAKVKDLKDQGVETTWFSRMYLTGQYAKNDKLMGVATQLGAGLDVAALKASGSSGPKPSKEQTKELGTLVYDARLKNDFFAKIKLSFALAQYGATIGPALNQIFGSLPFAMGGGPDWDHFSDYTHHKLLVADGRVFQMGGRNIQDSYHTDGYADKYTFIDTDFYGESEGAVRIESAYDQLASFSAMVGDMAKVEKYLPTEYNVNTMPFMVALDMCMKKYQGIAAQNPSASFDMESCVNQTMPGVKGIPNVPDYKSMSARMTEAANKVAEGKKTFLAKYAPKGDQFRFDWNKDTRVNKDPGAEFYYLENTSYSRENPSVRLFGSKVDLEHENGKNIHAAWARGIENTCAIAAKGGPKKRIVLHSAYFLMSSNLVGAIGNALNGKWDCKNVQIDIITNSFLTSDLNILNVFARYQLRSLFKFYYDSSAVNKATLRYSEYRPQVPEDNPSGKKPKSLHSKVTVLGDDIVIGSANADVRSYFMDTNNAIMIRNAPNLVADYLAFLDRISSPNNPPEDIMFWEAAIVVPSATFNGKTDLSTERMNYAAVTDEQLDRQNHFVVEELFWKWLVSKEIKKKLAEGKALTPEEQTELAELEPKKTAARLFVKQKGNGIEKATDQMLLNNLGKEEMQELANKFDKEWKLF